MANFAVHRHVLSVCFPAFGHIMPQMELMKKLARADENLLITFVLSQAKVEETIRRGLIPSDLQHQIRIFPLQDKIPYNIDVDPGVNHKRDVKDAMESALKLLFDTIPVADYKEKLEINQSQLNQLDTPLLNPFFEPVQIVITDCFVGLPAKLCAARNIPCYMFATSCAMTVPMFLTISEEIPVVPDETYYEPSPPGSLQLQKVMKDFLIFTRQMIELSSGIVINSFRELEPHAVAAMQKVPQLQKIPVFFTGPLLPEEPSANIEELSLKEKITQWLDQQEDRSVVYVSFGSMVFPAVEQLLEMAKALISLGRPFIWSLKHNEQKHLPEDLWEKITKQCQFASGIGFLILNWVPQSLIITHRAVKVFVSHCGWNGTVEALVGGLAVVAWPMYGDQPLNAGFLVQSKVAVLVPDTSLRSKTIKSAEEIKDFIETVGQWKEEKKDENNYFENAQRISETAATVWRMGGSSLTDLQSLRQAMFGQQIEKLGNIAFQLRTYADRR